MYHFPSGPEDQECLDLVSFRLRLLPPLPGRSLTRTSRGKTPSTLSAAHLPKPLPLLLAASCPSLPATHCHLSHRRPGILVLINDADWELLVSTSGTSIPQPLPSLI